MTTEPTPRRSVFAVWHWPQWVWFAIIPPMLAAYVQSAGVILFLAEMDLLNDVPAAILYPVSMAFYPGYLAIENCEFLGSILNWEQETLLWIYERPVDRPR